MLWGHKEVVRVGKQQRTLTPKPEVCILSLACGYFAGTKALWLRLTVILYKEFNFINTDQ